MVHKKVLDKLYGKYLNMSVSEMEELDYSLRTNLQKGDFVIVHPSDKYYEDDGRYMGICICVNGNDIRSFNTDLPSNIPKVNTYSRLIKLEP